MSGVNVATHNRVEPAVGCRVNICCCQTEERIRERRAVPYKTSSYEYKRGGKGYFGEIDVVLEWKHREGADVYSLVLIG